MKKHVTKITVVILTLVFLLSACIGPGGLKPTETSGPSTQESPSVLPSTTEQPTATTPSEMTPTSTSSINLEDVYPKSFAQYVALSVSLPNAFGADAYTLPLDLAQVQGMDTLELNEAQRNLLTQNGFVVVPSSSEYQQEFYQIYDSMRYNEIPVFVTTDSVYHVYHLIFDKMLRDLETEYFIKDLELLTSAMLQASSQQYQALKGTILEEPALRNVAYFGVAAQLLGLPDSIPAEAQPLVEAELALILPASSSEISPIWDREDLPPDEKLIEVYGQYVPRGHYTRSETLERYFLAMMWYGRMTFRLDDDFETRRALLVVQALRSAQASDGRSAVELWQNIYDPTVFIVGKADDLGYHEYGAIMDQVFGPNPDPMALADETLFAEFKQAAENLPPPQINSMWVWIWQDKEQVTKGFRFMGQRFTLDAYVFGQLIWRNVGTLENPRGLPKALDFFAAMGSEEAYNILEEMGETQYANYDTQLEKVRNEISMLGMDSWTQNLYWNWLYALQPLIEPKGTSYPPFMQTQAWARKDLQTALGSWTELKHDTILYAKQVMAEMGGGEPEIPHGYVEPNPEAYARLLALCQMTFDGLEQRNLLSDLTRGNLENLMEELNFLKDISERELAGDTPTEEEYRHLYYWGGVLEEMTLAAADTSNEFDRDLSDQKAALVVDVATGMTPDGRVSALEEAIGQPAIIYVVLPDSPWRIGAGAVYTYYEFTVPSDARLTDEAWQEMLANGENPPQPEWTQSFIAP